MNNHSFLLWLFESRVEISTPISSWKSIKEGLWLINNKYSPYANNIFHNTPFILKLFEYLLQISQHGPVIFLTLTEIITTINIYIIANNAQSFVVNKGYIDIIKKEPTNFHCSKYFSLYAACFYYFNPFVFVTSLCKSISSVAHVLITLTIVFSIKKNITISGFIMGLAIVMDIYPLLLMPIAIKFCCLDNEKYRLKIILLYIITTIISFYIFLLFNLSLLNENETKLEFIRQYFIFVLSGNDPLPNIGPWWYIRMSLFPQFISFFTIILQSQSIIFSISFLIRFNDYPYLVLYLIIHTFEIFRIYPTISDTMLGYTFCLITSCILYKNSKHILIIITLFIVSILLLFFMWFMWIDFGIGNPNFYYAANLMFMLSNIYLICSNIASSRRFHSQFHSKK